MNKPDPAKWLFLLSCALIIFGYGVAVGHYQFFPYSVIEFGKDSLVSVFEDRGTITATRPQRFLSRARHEGNGVTISKPEQMAPGLTFIQGFFDGENEMRLVEAHGRVLNRWRVRLYDIFPTIDHIQPQYRKPQTNWNVEIHGGLALPDGSIVFNFERAGLVKLDRCGKLAWSLPLMTHHAIERAENGGYWALRQEYVQDKSRFPFLETPYIEEKILKISETGQVVQEISVLDLYFSNNLHALFFSNGLEGIRLPKDELAAEITHINDVEELSTRKAGRFPKFAAGDLMISDRDYNLVMVFDPQTLKIRWHSTGPWIGQHDPDFTENGTISVFNNNNDLTETGTILGGSNITEIDPRTGKTQILYGGQENQKWFADIRGKHQVLENGNILITETGAGRIFEVSAGGDAVWEYINRYDEDEVALVTQAIRYPPGYFSVEDWSCP